MNVEAGRVLGRKGSIRIRIHGPVFLLCVVGRARRRPLTEGVVRARNVQRNSSGRFQRLDQAVHHRGVVPIQAVLAEPHHHEPQRLHHINPL